MTCRRPWTAGVSATAGAAVLVALVAIFTAVDRTAEVEAAGAARPVEVGLASYYGPGFHGERTASGRIFDQRQLVAAHRSLPFGSVVRVTNLENGRSVTVRIVDRGPYGRNRRKGTIIDLSKGAARRIRSIHDGIVRVRVEVVRQPPGPRRDPR